MTASNRISTNSSLMASDVRERCLPHGVRLRVASAGRTAALGL
jgi:hypothetical protein